MSNLFSYIQNDYVSPEMEPGRLTVNYHFFLFIGKRGGGGNKWLYPYIFVLVCINIVFSLSLSDTLEIKTTSTLINNAHFYAYISKFLFSFNCHHMLDLYLFPIKIQPYLHYFMPLVPIFLSYTCRFLSAFPQHRSLWISIFPFSHEKRWGLAMAWVIWSVSSPS